MTDLGVGIPAAIVAWFVILAVAVWLGSIYKRRTSCPHADQTEPSWTQAGWCSRCRDCGDVVCHGDDWYV